MSKPELDPKGLEAAIKAIWLAYNSDLDPGDGDIADAAIRAYLAATQGPGPTYPCAHCGTLRTKAEGGTTFTVCDDCWKIQECGRE